MISFYYIKQIYPKLLDVSNIKSHNVTVETLITNIDVHNLNEFLDRFFEWVDRDDVDLNDESVKSFVKTIVDYLLKSNDHLVFSQRLYPWIRDYKPPSKSMKSNYKTTKSKSEIKLEILSTPTPIHLFNFYKSGFLVKLLKSNNSTIITNIISLVKYQLFSENSWGVIGYQSSLFPLNLVENAINNDLIESNDLPNLIDKLLYDIYRQSILKFTMTHESMKSFFRMAIEFSPKIVKLLYNQSFKIMDQQEIIKLKDIYNQIHHLFFENQQLDWFNNLVIPSVISVIYNPLYSNYISQFGQDDFNNQAIKIFLDDTSLMSNTSKKTLTVALGALSSICTSNIINEHLLTIYVKKFKNYPESLADQIISKLLNKSKVMDKEKESKQYKVISIITPYCSTKFLSESFSGILVKMVNYGDHKFVNDMVMSMGNKFTHNKKFENLYQKLFINVNPLFQSDISPLIECLVHYNKDHTQLQSIMNQMVESKRQPRTTQEVFYALKLYQSYPKESRTQDFIRYMFSNQSCTYYIYKDEKFLSEIDDYFIFEYLINNAKNVLYHFDSTDWRLFKCCIDKGWNSLVLDRFSIFYGISSTSEYLKHSFIQTFQNLLNMDEKIQKYLLTFSFYNSNEQNYAAIISKFIDFSEYYKQLVTNKCIIINNVHVHEQLFFKPESEYYIGPNNSGINQNEYLELNLLFIEKFLTNFCQVDDLCIFVSFFSVIDDTDSTRFQNIKSQFIELFKQLNEQSQTKLLDHIVKVHNGHLNGPKQWNYLFDQSLTNFYYQPFYVLKSTTTDLSLTQLPIIIIKSIMLNLNSIRSLATVSKSFHKMITQLMTTKVFYIDKPILSFRTNCSSPYSLLHNGVYEMKYDSFVYYLNQESREDILYQVSSLTIKSNLLYRVNRDLLNLIELKIEFNPSNFSVFNSSICNLLCYCPNVQSCYINIIDVLNVEPLIPLLEKIEKLPSLTKIHVYLQLSNLKTKNSKNKKTKKIDSGFTGTNLFLNIPQREIVIGERYHRFFEWVDRDDVDLNDESIKSFVNAVVNFLIVSDDHLVFIQRLYPWIRDYTPTSKSTQQSKSKSEIKLELLSTPTPLHLFNYYKNGFLVKMLKSNNSTIIINVITSVLKYQMFLDKFNMESIEPVGFQNSLFPINLIEDALNNGIINQLKLKQIRTLVYETIYSFISLKPYYKGKLNCESIESLFRLIIKFSKKSEKNSLIEILYNLSFKLTEQSEINKHKDIYNQIHQFFFANYQIYWFNHILVIPPLITEIRNKFYSSYILQFGQDDFDNQAIKIFLDGTTRLSCTKKTLNGALGALSSICTSKIIKEHLLIIYSKLCKILETRKEMDALVLKILIIIVRKFKNCPETLADLFLGSLGDFDEAKNHHSSMITTILPYCSIKYLNDHFDVIVSKFGNHTLVNEMVMSLGEKFTQLEGFENLYQKLLKCVNPLFQQCVSPLIECVVHYNKDRTQLQPIMNQITEVIRVHPKTPSEAMGLLKLYQSFPKDNRNPVNIEYLFKYIKTKYEMIFNIIDDESTFEFIINDIRIDTFTDHENWVIYMCCIDKGWSDLVLKRFAILLKSISAGSFSSIPVSDVSIFIETFQKLLNMDKIIQEYILTFLADSEQNLNSRISVIRLHYGPIISKFTDGFTEFYRELIPKMGEFLIGIHEYLFFKAKSSFCIYPNNYGANTNEYFDLNLLLIETILKNQNSIVNLQDYSSRFDDLCRFVSFFSIIDDSDSARFQKPMIEIFKNLNDESKTRLLDYIVSKLHANLDESKKWNYLFDQSQTNFQYQPTTITKELELKSTPKSSIQLPITIIKSVILMSDMLNLKGIKILSLVSHSFHNMITQWMNTNLFKIKPILSFNFNNNSPFSLLHKGVYHLKYNSLAYFQNQDSREDIFYRVSSLDIKSNLLYIVNRDLLNLIDLKLEFNPNNYDVHYSSIVNLLCYCPNLQQCDLNIIGQKKVDLLLPVFNKLQQISTLTLVNIRLQYKNILSPSTKSLLDNHFTNIKKFVKFQPFR
ncbi:hypothetical protein DLAC_09830 [Tieghemostelium lacteum]|uniref:F-box domain-containing protein n=1 Tax=Tieghemostelium lacteum TaxID=361077 RepID=A0A151Z7E2_TIELA|nr:hypothetical protein DLAC_09830 [Tieghemostelium lacteum]|eukprot:KYQ89855.1 hypothetical protein DLAC_09830 [Tieghemostelium lacteum]